MTTTIINKDTYFRQNIYVTTINIGSKPFLNIPNMSVIGDVSMNSITIGALTTASLDVKNNTTLNFNYNVVNNSTKIATSIGYTNTVSYLTSTAKFDTYTGITTIITKTNIPAGVYIFFYGYSVISNANTLVLNQFYDVITNTTTSTNILTKNNTWTFTSVTNYSGNTEYTTFGVLTSALNTITFGQGNAVGSSLSSGYVNNHYLTYTRIA